MLILRNAARAKMKVKPEVQSERRLISRDKLKVKVKLEEIMTGDAETIMLKVSSFIHAFLTLI